MKYILFCYFLLLNGLSCYMMWSDKRKARKNMWRIPERDFFLISLLGGSLGCWIGMQLFRHKTQHITFTVGIPIILLVQIAIGMWILGSESSGIF